MDSYRTELLAERGSKPGGRTATSGDNKATRVDQRRQAAERRAELAPLKKVMQSAEQAVAKLTAEIAKADQRLADPALYADAAKAQKLSIERGQLARKLSDAEDAWLAATDAYEQAEALTG